jgi:hypothetical protein
MERQRFTTRRFRLGLERRRKEQSLILRRHQRCDHSYGQRTKHYDFDISDTGLQPPGIVNSMVKYTSGSSTTAAQASDVVSALGFTPQNANGPNAAGGYAGLDANGLLLVNEIPLTIRSSTSGCVANSGGRTKRL